MTTSPILNPGATCQQCPSHGDLALTPSGKIIVKCLLFGIFYPADRAEVCRKARITKKDGE